MKKVVKKATLFSFIMVLGLGALTLNASSLSLGGGKSIYNSDVSNSSYTSAQARYDSKGNLGAKISGLGSCHDSTGWTHHNDYVQSDYITCYNSGHANGWLTDVSASFSKN